MATKCILSFSPHELMHARASQKLQLSTALHRYLDYDVHVNPLRYAWYPSLNVNNQ